MLLIAIDCYWAIAYCILKYSIVTPSVLTLQPLQAVTPGGLLDTCPLFTKWHLVAHGICCSCQNRFCRYCKQEDEFICPGEWTSAEWTYLLPFIQMGVALHWAKPGPWLKQVIRYTQWMTSQMLSQHRWVGQCNVSNRIEDWQNRSSEVKEHFMLHGRLVAFDWNDPTVADNSSAVHQHPTNYGDIGWDWEVMTCRRLSAGGHGLASKIINDTVVRGPDGHPPRLEGFWGDHSE